MLYREQNRPLDAQRSIDRAISIFEHLGASLDLERARNLD
jgi:flagellin-specific chaperone FliS